MGSEHEHMPARGLERRRQVESPPPRHALLELQRTVGNAAVTRVLMRYGTGEHALMGGARTVTLHGLQVTESELLTMGDLYLTAQAMQADAKGFPALLKLVRRDAEFRKGVPGATKVSDAEWEAATAHMPKGQHYSDLALDNDTHFAPYAGETTKGNHRNEWLKWHQAAVNKTAEHVRKGGKGVPNEAVILNGFGGHFLTDAFAAGHILAKQEIKDFAINKADALGADETWFDIIPESSFSVGVAERLLAHAVAGKKLRQYKIRIVQWGDMSVTKLSEAIYHVQDDEPDTFFGAFAQIVHDKLNQSIKANSPFGPLEVMNDRGTKWTLAGDGNLALSPETLAVAKQAVEQSHQNLVDVANDPSRAGQLGTMYHKVWEYVPWPTVKGHEMIERVLATYADPARAETQAEVAEFLVDEIDIVIAKLKARNRLATPEEAAKQDHVRRRKAALDAAGIPGPIGVFL